MPETVETSPVSQRERFESLQAAILACSQALRADPCNSAMWYLLGTVYQDLGLFEEAAVSNRHALGLAPDHGAAAARLHLLEQGSCRLVQPAAGGRTLSIPVLAMAAEAHFNLGLAFGNQGRTDEAANCFSQAIRLRPDYGEAHNNLGVILEQKGKLAEATACFEHAVQATPANAAAHANLGAALELNGRFEEAEAALQEALRLQPDLAQAHSNLGNVYKSQGKAEEAVACYHRALSLNPDYAEAYNNLGYVLKNLGRLDEALACVDQALVREPNYPLAHLNRATILFLRGQFQEAWTEHEWRWQTKEFGGPRAFRQPAWDGSSLAGRTILLYSEQGLGDTLQFIRYAPLVKLRGGTVLVECQRPLVPLLSRSPGIDQLIAQGSELPPFDVQSPLMSLPRIFRTSLDNIPATVPYVFPDPQRLEHFQRQLSGRAFRIGVVWQGNPDNPRDRERSFVLRCLMPIAMLPRVQLLSLQVGHGGSQLSECASLFLITDLARDLDESSFTDTAAVMKSLDLVIAPDTAVAHLAGALAQPVWIALSHVPDARWLLDRQDSPWYPTARLFRQERPGDWAGVFARMAAALQETAKMSS
jgi:tetratricopeptide (TPR) repeat protein